MQRRVRSSSNSPKRSDEDKPPKIDEKDKSVLVNKFKLSFIIKLIIGLGLLVTYNSIQITLIKNQFDIEIENEIDRQELSAKPKIWIVGENMEVGYLKHVFEIFQRIGYQWVNGSIDPNWDVLWSHDYPFGSKFFRQLKSHQRVNHFPGSGFITNKVNLATTDLLHIPKSFNLPRQKDEFLEYVSFKNKNKMWVKKSNDHRGIKIQKIDEFDLNASGTFVQEYIDKPFLINKRKFDIGIYVTLTSLNPIRLYIYDSDVLLRFCANDYHPFDPNNIHSYVVDDHYTPIWDIPDLKRYYVDANMNMKESLNSFLRYKKLDPNKIWNQIEQSIKSVYIAKEKQMSRLTKMLHLDTKHFFEMVRFDFIVDEDLNCYLMEANMSPNLSSLHFKPNQLLYEQVIYNLISLTGLNQLETISNWNDLNQTEFFNYKVSDKDISVNFDLCSSNDCHLSCKKEKCRSCYFCLSDEFKTILKKTYLEHLNRYNNKRLLPDLGEDALNSDFENNQLLIEWLRAKCENNYDWCQF